MSNPDYIFLAEDDESSALYMKMVLNHSKYNVPLLHFSSGESLIQQFKSLSNDDKVLLIIDFNLGDMTGLDVLNTLNGLDKYNPDNLSVIALSTIILNDQKDRLLSFPEVLKMEEKPLVLSMIEEFDSLSEYA